MEYEGTRYHGSQYQVNALTIQGETEDALRRITGEEIRISFASRTDAGVHARGQVASFKTRSTFPHKTWVEALNFHLPKDISVRVAYEAGVNFDVRRDAVCRNYRYSILNRSTPSPLWRGFSYLIARPLDIEAMNDACQALIGEHDFAPFAQVTDGRQTHRRVSKAEVSKKEDLVMFDIEANSFLPHQVRNTVGGLAKVGLGKMTVNLFREMACSKQAGIIGPTAPARGLCLMEVRYDNFPPC